MKPISLVWERFSIAWQARIAAAFLVISLLGAIYLASARLLSSQLTRIEFQVLVVLTALGLISLSPMYDIFFRHFAWAQARQRKLSETQFLAYLLNVVQQAVIVTDSKGRITFWNPYAERLFGWSHSEVTGQSALEVLLDDTTRAPIQDIRTAIKSGQAWSGELTARHRDERVIPIGLTYTPFFDEQDVLIGMVALPEDILNRRLAERQDAARQQLASALEGANTFDELAPLIVEKVMLLAHALGCALARFTPTSGEMLIEQSSGRLAHWNGVHWMTKLIPGTQIITENYDLSALRAVLPQLFAGTNSVTALSLVVPGELLGLLVISHSEEITPEELSVLHDLAGTIAKAINRVNLLEIIRQQGEQIACFASINKSLASATSATEVYTRLARAIFDRMADVASATITCYNADKNLDTTTYTIFANGDLENTLDPSLRLDAQGSDLASQVFHTAQAMICHDLQAVRKGTRGKTAFGPAQPLPQSALLVPLISQDRVIGVIQVLSYSLNRFQAGDLSLLSILAGTAALALKNARLRELDRTA